LPALNQKAIATFSTALFVILGFGIGAGILSYKNKSVVPPQKINNENSKKVESAQETPKVNQPKNEELYTVKNGDTLFLLSVKYNIAIETLLKANNLQNADQIKVGQVIKIPLYEAGGSSLNLDEAKMKEIQELVDLGSQPWRLDPVEVVKADIPANYGFTALDVYNLIKKDDTQGEAEVEVEKTSANKKTTYKVSLVQPVKKGEKGIWAISSIKK